MKEEIAKSGKSVKYGFEEKIRGKNNLNFIDVESIETPDYDKEFQYYEKILRDYENNMKEIKEMSNAIEDDVINEEDAINEVKQHMQEERNLEKRLGSRFIAKIDDEEAGS